MFTENFLNLTKKKKKKPIAIDQNAFDRLGIQYIALNPGNIFCALWLH